jgi:hypothetical protein
MSDRASFSLLVMWSVARRGSVERWVGAIDGVVGVESKIAMAVLMTAQHPRPICGRLRGWEGRDDNI